ncbi:DUF6858 family protein [Sulfurospirillum arcachonense]|uniref:DUF6858 family protein n=1 Tax=Sulfurospirillum arcachonense TaxID=57666 RepID=UPI00046943D0|nr:hypothetical protein [Sulfurospirillum arcachonense]
MKKTIFMDKYPVYTLKLEKNEVEQKNIAELIEYYKEKIDNHKIAKFISIFDHYAHTKSLDGEIMEGLLDAKNIIFCFGHAIPNTKMVAARPRSIGICEFDKYFIIEFLEAPKEELHALMESWTKALVK